jgi:hypothetical protein
MKLRAVIILSLALNLLLVGGVLWRMSHREIKLRAAEGGFIPRRTVRMGYVTNEASPERIEVKAPFNWSELESTDYRVYVTNLRSIGCPEDTIHDIIEADLEELFAGKVKEMVDGVTGRFWEFMVNTPELERLVKEKQDELESLNKQRVEVLEVLFPGNTGKGIRERRPKVEEQMREDSVAFLPADKAAAVKQCEDRFLADWADFEKANPGLSYEERQAKHREQVANKESEIEALLTPAEWEEYRMRKSNMANERMNLADLDITSDQMRDIVRASLNTNRTEAVKQVLGTDQAVAYQRALDSQYHLALKLSEKFNLPHETAEQVYAMQSEATARATEIRNDTSRSIEERESIMQAIKAETDRSMSAALGAKAFKAFQQNAGEWFPTIPQNAR